MSTSYIAIYKTNITPDRNALVDSLEDYLATCTKTYENNAFQYQKTTLDLTIKIDTTGSYTVDQRKNTYAIGNYVKIRQDAKNFYYFIVKSNWISESVIMLNLAMDTINTYNGNFTWSDKTKVKREHKDRFWIKDKFIANTDTTLHKIVDERSEGINPVLIKAKDDIVTNPVTSEQVDTNYYLIYRTPDDIGTSNQPIEVALVSKDPVYIFSSNSTPLVLNYSWFDMNKYYYFTYADNGGASYTATPSGGTAVTKTLNGTTAYTYKVKRVTSTTLQYWLYNSDGVEQASASNYISITVQNNLKVRVSTEDTKNLYKISNFADLDAESGNRRLAQLSSIDRTDSRIVKIIELPYLPTEIAWSGNTLVSHPGWTLNANNELILDDYTAEFERDIAVILFSDLEVTIPGDTLDNLKIKTKDINNESKLLHSDIYNLKLGYDSFALPIMLERYNNHYEDIGGQSNYTKAINILYKQSNTTNSSLLFKWDPPGTNYKYKSLGDYDRYLLSNRNNEVITYTNNYLNYMRTDYNYDRKNADISNIQSAIGIGTNLVSTVAGGLALGSSIQSFADKLSYQTYDILGNGNKLYGAEGLSASQLITGKLGLNTLYATNQFSSGISSLASNIMSIQQTEQSLQQKQDQLKAQATTVAGANDLDLLNKYNGNKLHVVTYKPSDRLVNDLWNLFFYYGYADDESKLPTTDSRLWFNYIQCEPVFKNESTDVTYNAILDDVKNRYRAGVTRYHCNVINSVKTWDWNQQYENWETRLFS